MFVLCWSAAVLSTHPSCTEGLSCGTEIKSSGFIVLWHMCVKVQSQVFRLGTPVVNPDSCVLVPPGRRRNCCGISGGSRTDPPSWSGCSQTPE